LTVAQMTINLVGLVKGRGKKGMIFLAGSHAISVMALVWLKFVKICENHVKGVVVDNAGVERLTYIKVPTTNTSQ